MHTWKILATLLIETLLERIRKGVAKIVMARKDKPQDSSRKPPIKIDHEFVAAEDDGLKASDQVQFFKGAQLCTMGTACLIWKIQGSSRSLSR